jgi:excisionase family DNA binding protein
MTNSLSFHEAEYETTAPGARYIGVSENTLRRMAARGEIASIRTGSGVRLFSRDELARVREERLRRDQR